MLLMLKKLAGSCSLVDRGRKEREKKRAFLNNVGLALEKLVASFNIWQAAGLFPSAGTVGFLYAETEKYVLQSQVGLGPLFHL
jgi:hypothetical protein